MYVRGPYPIFVSMRHSKVFAKNSKTMYEAFAHKNRLRFYSREMQLHSTAASLQARKKVRSQKIRYHRYDHQNHFILIVYDSSYV